MLSIVTENLIGSTEIRVLGLALVLWISMYSTYWVCGKLFDYKCDIFKKKKKSRRRSWLGFSLWYALYMSKSSKSKKVELPKMDDIWAKIKQDQIKNIAYI